MTTNELLESASETTASETTEEKSAGAGMGVRFGSFLMQPFRLQSLGRALYCLLAFPLGLFYFVALIVGTSVGVPLTLIWIGFLVLAITGALLWGFVSFERELAKLLLGAELAPMRPPARGEMTLTRRVGVFLGNPVTWKGAAFLILKFPLGLASFVAVVVSLSASTTFLLGPFLYQDFGFGIDLGPFYWRIDTLPEAVAASLFGLVALFVSLHLLNALGLGWRWLAEGMLGSESHRSVPSNGEAVPVAALPAT